MSANPYKRLPGRYWGLGYGASLWEAEDHLLLVRWILVTESYNRFYFRDIQAISYCTTSTWMVRGVLFGVGAALFGIPAILAGEYLLWLLGIPAIFLLIGMGLDFWAGPTCKTTIQTAVQTQTISSLHRRKNARAVIERVRGKILAAQTEARS